MQQALAHTLHLNTNTPGEATVGAKKKSKPAAPAALSQPVQDQTQALVVQSQNATKQLADQAAAQQQQFAAQQAASQKALQDQQQAQAKQQEQYQAQLQAYLQQLQAAQEQQKQASLARQQADEANAVVARADAEANSTSVNLFAANQAASASFKAKTSGAKKGVGGFIA